MLLPCICRSFSDTFGVDFHLYPSHPVKLLQRITRAMAPHAQFQGNEDDDHPVFAAKQLDVCGVHLLTFNNVQCFFSATEIKSK